MSIEAMKWALDVVEGTEICAADRYVLLLLGNLANSSGGRLFPSHAYLARRTGMAKSTVREHLDSLEQLKLIKRLPRAREVGGGQTSNSYQLEMPQAGLDLGEDMPGTVIAKTPPVPDSGTPRAGPPAPPVPAHRHPPCRPTGTHEVEVDGQDEKTRGAPSAPPPKGGSAMHKDKPQCAWTNRGAEPQCKAPGTEPLPGGVKMCPEHARAFYARDRAETEERARVQREARAEREAALGQ